jgi:magnesium transporter
MIKTLANWPHKGFQWLDLTQPSEEDVHALHAQFAIPKLALQDCLKPVHLPQYVPGENSRQLFLRAYDREFVRADTVQDITRKVVAFWGEGFLITP